jgi:hypothetical protein
MVRSNVELELVHHMAAQLVWASSAGPADDCSLPLKELPCGLYALAADNRSTAGTFFCHLLPVKIPSDATITVAGVDVGV